MPKANKKPQSKNASAPRVNKSAWIRSQPRALSAKEVVAKAKVEGIQLSLAQVYTARSTAKRQTEPQAAAKRGRPTGRATNGRESDLRKQFIQLAVRLGTEEAQRLLDSIAVGDFASRVLR